VASTRIQKPPPALARPLQAGVRVGPFTILEKLYDGSISTVYKVRQDRLGRMVALKVLAEYPPPPDAVLQRFNRAAYVSAQVVHANLVVLYESGTADGYHYAALEFVPGQTLYALIKSRKRLSERRALSVGAQIARALTALHEKGILHRNVKPKNILVDTTNKARLIGLGLCHCGAMCFSEALDAQGVGTPHYMAPEVIRGEGLEPRSDLYSLGATLYAALTGRPPFEHGEAAVIMAKHLHEQPVPLQDLRPDLSAEFIALVDQLLAKDPHDRPGSAREAAELLEKLAANRDEPPEPGEAGRPPPHAWAVTAQPLSRAKILALSLALGAAAALAAFGSWHLLHPSGGPDEAGPPAAVTPEQPPMGLLAPLAGWGFWRALSHPEGAPPEEGAAPSRWDRLVRSWTAPGDGADELRVEQEFVRLVAQDALFRRQHRGVAEWSAFLREFPRAPAAYRKEAEARIQEYRRLQGTAAPAEGPTAGELEF